MAVDKAIVASGCFWGAQELLGRRPGVIQTRVGYSGGETPNATYRNRGNHAEAVEVTFEAERISYPVTESPPPARPGRRRTSTRTT